MDSKSDKYVKLALGGKYNKLILYVCLPISNTNGQQIRSEFISLDDM